MATRRKERELALQLAYAMDMTREGFEEARYKYTQSDPRRRAAWGEFAERLASCARQHEAEIDERLKGALKNWRIERLSAVDRCVLRLAACELLFFPEVPARVTIDEYVEAARQYGADESASFVNGVLDALARSCPGKRL